MVVFGEPDELFVMKRSAPAATPVARCHASARRPNVWPGTAAEIRTPASKASTVKPSARRPTRCHPGDEFLGPFDAHGQRIGEAGASTAIEEVAQSFGFGERLVGASNPDRIGTNEDSDPSAMTGDGDLLAGEHTVKDFWQRGSSLAEGH